DFGSVPARKRIVLGHEASDLRSDAQTDFAAAHFGKRANAASAVFLIGLADLALADFFKWPREIAVPLHGVHGEVEMAINEEHRVLSFEEARGFDHRRIVAVNFDRSPNFFYNAIGADEKRGARDAHLLLAIHVLFAPRAKLFGDFVVWIGEQREIQ